MLNKVMLVGNLGNKPERKQYNETVIVTFRIATSDGWGENKTTTWHNVKMFGQLAETVYKYMDKGKLVLVEGRISNSVHNDKFSSEVVASSVQFLSSSPNKE